jgi:hypothetical protein
MSTELATLQLQALTEARARIQDPMTWIKGSFDEWDEFTKRMSYCLVGAMQGVDSHTFGKIQAAANAHFPDRYNRFKALSEFNDHTDTTHEDVLLVIDTAIEELRNEVTAS